MNTINRLQETQLRTTDPGSRGEERNTNKKQQNLEQYQFISGFVSG